MKKIKAQIETNVQHRPQLVIHSKAETEGELRPLFRIYIRLHV